MKIVIDHKFITLNEYIEKERIPYKGRYIANDIKSKETGLIKYFCKGMIQMTYPVRITFIWHINSKRQDLDNIGFAKKFILDGLVKAGTLKNDNLNHIQGLEDKVIFDNKECVEIEISEV
jgi:Holliday junction resolvase RusA-like endonuclease